MVMYSISVQQLICCVLYFTLRPCVYGIAVCVCGPQSYVLQVVVLQKENCDALPAPPSLMCAVCKVTYAPKNIQSQFSSIERECRCEIWCYNLCSHRCVRGVCFCCDFASKVVILDFVNQHMSQIFNSGVRKHHCCPLQWGEQAKKCQSEPRVSACLLKAINTFSLRFLALSAPWLTISPSKF